ncbi:MAG: hypothetical protein JKX75_10165 [Gammaproteobacteria bacterium]|nr:hypothetical protein [Gammaproteobacteria bacterium]
MRSISLSIFALLLLTSITACSSNPEPKHNPYGNADDQRSRAHQTQGELSSETKK